MTGDPEGYRIVKFRLLDKNWELLYSVSALQGEHMETVLHRATALYEIMHRAQPGSLVKWDDRDGETRSVMVLPATIPLPWYLRWVGWLGIELTFGAK